MHTVQSSEPLDVCFNKVRDLKSKHVIIIISELPWLILDGTQTIRYCYHRSPLTRTHHAKEGVRRGVRAGASVRIACAVIIDLRRQPRGFTSPLSSLQPISNSRRHRYPHINNRFVFNKYIKVLIGYYKIICTYLS